MTLLEFEGVSKRYGHGTHERIALRDVSFQVDAGELVAVWGRRRSGRSTLLRVAATVETPDTGVIRFEGHSLKEGGERSRKGVRYCRKTFRPADGHLVLDQLVTSQLPQGVSIPIAQSRARDALERTGAEPLATLRPGELDNSEAICAAIARALVHRPKLLVIDEPTLGVELLDRDRILALLRSLSDEGIAVLMSAGETSCLSAAHRALALSKGELLGKQATPELAPVVPLRHATG